ncbi:sensor histidine kinase [Arthrobacter sp. TB 23]|uniref:sensor histidine kinase n=1 Tax=Arthrobacter sp. TB 23 TaxID=494419 RepID=UPI0002F7DCB7|nr:sensor histidine kinase [Arthrobacter sp. TB 23]
MRKWSLARQFFAGQLVFVLALTAAISWVLYLDAEQNTYETSADRMLAIATTFADDPFVSTSLELADPSAALQPYAIEVMDDLGVDFITIMAPDRTRFTHRNPEEIGSRYIGSVEQALAGRSHTETFSGTLGPSVRAIMPVTDGDGEVVAMVAAGVTVNTVTIARNAQLPLLFLIAAGAVTAGAAVSFLLSRHLRRATLGLGTDQLSHMFVFYDSVLHSVREGLVLTNPRGELVLYNDQAAHLLGLPPARAGQPTAAAGLDLPPSLVELLTTGRQAIDEFHVTTDRILVVNQEAAVPGGGTRASGAKPLGTVTTLRDHTEIESLTGELQTMRTLTDALRAQTHEHANRLHTIVSLIELDRRAEALDFATRDLTRSQQLTDDVLGALDEPFITALLVGKAAQANERGIELAIAVDGSIETSHLDPSALVTIIGNLLDNAFDAAADSLGRKVSLTLERRGDNLELAVRDSGSGLTAAGTDAFTLGFSTKETEVAGGPGRGLGLALVRQAVQRLGGAISVANDDGARFTVLLPLDPTTTSPTPLPGGTHV